MDRQPHDYGAPMAYGSQPQPTNMQQQQYSFHPQHQQFPPFLPPHPSLQQFPYPRPMQQTQIYPHLPPPHLHQPGPPPSFPPHMPPHILPSPFHGQFDSPPPPSDPELQKRIDKLIEYALKNGPEFEAVVREREQDNPAYSFLFGGEGHSYYRHKLFIATRPHMGPFNPPFQSSIPFMHPPNPMMGPNPPMGSAHLQQPPFPYYEQQHQLNHSQTQSMVGHGHPEFDQTYRPFKGLSRPLPSDVEIELNDVLNNLTGTKESIKSAKTWFMQRLPFVPDLAEALRDRVFSLDDYKRQLHIVYLANDILFDSLQRRANPKEPGNESLAFKPVLGSMLSRVYHNPHNKEENQSRLRKILQFWASNEVYDQETIFQLEKEMLIESPPNPFPGPHLPAPGIHDKQKPDHDKQVTPVPQPPPILSDNKLPPYPLFPPGLIPGMIRKMQIGSGVPYSPMSPLDIPTVIPPSNVAQSEILERVSKFFREIGEVNPSVGPMRDGDGDDEYEYEYERDVPARKGGTCIPPPASLNFEAESVSGSGRLGLGARADSNETSQYDDVYSSYRKHRSSNYHTTMSSRAATR